MALTMVSMSVSMVSILSWNCLSDSGTDEVTDDEVEVRVDTEGGLSSPGSTGAPWKGIRELPRSTRDGGCPRLRREWASAEGGPGGPPAPRAASAWATHAPGSMGRTGSVRGIVKYPFGFGSQHLATTSLMGPGFWTVSLRTRTASSLLMFSKLMSFTCRIMSPGSMRPSRATAPPFMMEPT
uniref:Secreted protein n=1 Tax=Ixodes ricinus TaxID=34613 RepID=A0A6B0V0B4_IXORI